MGAKFLLAILVQLTVQLLYPQNVFVIPCLCMQKYKSRKSSHDTEKAFVAFEKGSGLYEKNLSNWAFCPDAKKYISG